MRRLRAPLLVAAAVWLVSFALPTIDMGGSMSVAPGVLAAYFAFFVAPTVGLLLSTGAVHAADVPFALLIAAYYPTLAIGNLVVPLSLPRRIDLGRLPLAIALLAAAVPLTPWPQLWRVLELASGERVRLHIGYVVWLASLWLVALIPYVFRRTAAASPSAPGVRSRL